MPLVDPVATGFQDDHPFFPGSTFHRPPPEPTQAMSCRLWGDDSSVWAMSWQNELRTIAPTRCRTPCPPSGAVLTSSIGSLQGEKATRCGGF
jgi:hypothetical protein